MSVNKDAFYYNDKYYLLPADCADVDDLLRKHGDGKPFPVTCLKEKKCQAPYFISDYVKETNCRIKKGASVFPCQVELLTRSAYDQRLLTVVRSHCPGCPNFTDDGSVDGHHEEITLNHVCFFRDQMEEDSQDYAYFDVWIKNFVKAFPTLGLEQLIDDDKYTEAANVFSNALEEIALDAVPPVLAGKTEDGKYCLTFTSLMVDSAALLMEHLFILLAKKYKKTWLFLSGIPQGFELQHDNCPPLVPPLGVSFVYDAEAICKLSLTAYAREGEETGTYLWLCVHYGEAKFRTDCGDFQIVSVAEGEALPEDLLSPEDPAILKAMAASHAATPMEVRYPPISISLTSEDAVSSEDTVSSEEYRNVWLHTFRDRRLAYDFSIPLCHGVRPYDLWDREDMFSIMGFPVACVSFTSLPIDITKEVTPESDGCQQDISIIQELSEKGLCLKLSNSLSCGHISVCFLVLNLREFLSAIRHMSPLFARWPAELRIFTKSGKAGGRWKLDFDMKKLENEEQMLAGLIQNDAVSSENSSSGNDAE